MDFNTTIDIIVKDLREAREIIDDLKNYPGVPAIQVELAKSKCKSAEEVISLLKTIKKEPESPVAERVEKVEEVEKVEKVEVVERVEKKEAPVKTEVKADNKPPAVAEKINLAGAEKKLTENTILADKFSDISNTLHEQLGNIRGDADYSEVIKSKPVSDLFEAIGINEKFLYMREIFNGNQSSYNEAITKLNKVNNIADAKAVLMSYTGDSIQNDAVKQLIDLVKRKLPADE